jgi:hypothetical protein
MRLVRIIAALGAFPRLFAFFCEDCREAETIEDVPADVQSMAPWSGGNLHKHHEHGAWDKAAWALA